MIKLSTIFVRRSHWVSAFTGIIPWSFAIVTDQLSPTSSRSSSTSAPSVPLKTCSWHPNALVRGPHFFLNPIGRSFVHHQFITSTIALIMPYRPAEVTKQLLPCLYKLLQQITVICCMFPCYLTYSTRQCRPCAWSCLGFRPQRNRPPSYNIVHKDHAMVFVMPLTFTVQAPYLFMHLRSNYSVLLQTLHFKATILQLRMDLLNPQIQILHQCFMQSHCNLQGLFLSCNLLL